MAREDFCPQIPQDRELYKFFLTERVRYMDTDAQQFLYYGSYFNFFESARQEYWRRLGIKLDEILKSGFMIAVAETVCRYHAPARYDDILDIYVRTPDIRTRSFDIDFLVVRRTDDIVTAAARTSFVFMNAAEQAPCPIPNWMVTAIKQFEEQP